MAGQKTDERDAYVGQRIAEQRRRAALTQRRVAQSFGMSAAQLQKYEKGTNRISAVHLEILSRLTGVPLDYFFKGMRRLDDGPLEGFSERAQTPYSGRSSWDELAEMLARHVGQYGTEQTKRDFAAAVHALDQRLNG